MRCGRFSLVIILVLVSATPVAAGGKRKLVRPEPVNLAELDLREGDILLQHFASKLGSVIADVTDSQYSHCGMVVMQGGEPHVIEAIGPVRIIPAEDWFKQGHLHRFTQVRPRNLTREQISKVRREAEKMLGRPYDIQYEWDEQKIYCSELVYKAFDRALGIEVGSRQKLGDLNWISHPLFITYLAGGKLPLRRVMVTPESLVHSEHVKLITSTFPPRKDEPRHNQKVLAGRWRGEYSLNGREIGSATLQFAGGGEFTAGQLVTKTGHVVAIEQCAITPFRKSRSFQAQLKDSRGITSLADVQIRDDGDRLIGTWRDDLGNKGLLSCERMTDQTR